jgi:hypothetical protein
MTKIETKTKALEAIAGAADRPLKIGDIEIPCYVLEDETRVLSLRGMLGGLNMSLGRASSRREDRLTSFLTGNAISPFVSSKLTARIEHPIKFVPPGGGAVAYGYEATLSLPIFATLY